MNKIITLLKYSLPQMNIFNEGIQASLGKSKKAKRIILFIFLLGILLFTIGTYAYVFAAQLHPIDKTSYMLAMFIVISVASTFITAINKSQSVLFKCKDNDLLFSMPLDKKEILASRIIKLIIMQYIWIGIIMIPACAVYIFFEVPPLAFYISTLVQLITLPIIPTILGTAVGLIICLVSSKNKKSNLVQLLLNFVLLVVVFALSFTSNSAIENMSTNVTQIYNIIKKIYYPVVWYIETINVINWLPLLQQLFLPIAIFVIAIYIFGLKYFNIISKLFEHHTTMGYEKKKTKTKTKTNTQLNALIKKEIKRYFSSSTYVLNTLFGPVVLFVGAIYLIFNNVNQILQTNELTQLVPFLPIALIYLLCFTISTTAITASSISMEGKAFWLIKQIPININKIFTAKILTNCIITLPLIIIAICVVALKLQFASYILLAIILAAILMTVFSAVFGLLMNIKFPNFNASELVIVKQSISSSVTIFGLMIFLFVVAIVIFNVIPLDIFESILVYDLVYVVLNLVLLKILNTSGEKTFRQINN